MNQITTNNASLNINEKGIIHIHFIEKNVVINLSDSQEIYRARIKLGKVNEKQLILVDLRNNPKPNREARSFAKSKEMLESTKAMAMIVGSNSSRILGNFFVGLSRGDYPVKLFLKEKNATSEV